MRLRQLKQAEENAERTKIAEERLAEAKQRWAEEEADKAQRVEEHAAVVEARLTAKKLEIAAATKVRQEEERKAAIERKSMLEAAAKKQVMHQGELASAAEAKELVIAAAQRRRKSALAIQAEKSRLKFAEKRAFVDRKKRVEEARRRRSEELCEEKSAYSDGVRAQKREYLAMRRQMAISGQFQMRCLFKDAKNRNLKPDLLQLGSNLEAQTFQNGVQNTPKSMLEDAAKKLRCFHKIMQQVKKR